MPVICPTDGFSIQITPGFRAPETLAVNCWVPLGPTLAVEGDTATLIVVGGGVAANRVLRDRIAEEADRRGLPLVIPRPGLCTDNGAMIGAAGARRFAAGTRSGLDLDARPSLPLASPESEMPASRLPAASATCPCALHVGRSAPVTAMLP